MPENRIHRATSDDGTEIAGRVHGHGPPLVLISGTGDGENSPFLWPTLAERFTCYSMSLRGRGLSGEHPDHSPDRLVEDVTAFIAGIDGPVLVAGHSRGAALALSAAARATQVTRLVAYEPHAIELYDDTDVARAEDALGRMRGAVGEGRLADAAAVFFEDITLPGEGELSLLSKFGAFDLLAPLMPVLIQDIAQFGLPRPSHTLPLEQISVPVLILQGARTHHFYRDVARQVAGRLVDPHVHEIPDVGHFGPMFAPEAVFPEVAKFLSTDPEST
jgi:pimeloyl-ACP methyl ester carboxylesterase